MSTSQIPGKRGSRKIGRHKDKCAHYRGAKRLEHNRVKRIWRSNGPHAALIYAKRHGITVPSGNPPPG